MFTFKLCNILIHVNKLNGTYLRNYSNVDSFQTRLTLTFWSETELHFVFYMISYSSVAIRTRMHSSRIRTGRSLTVCCQVRGVCSGGGCLLPGGVCSGGGVGIPACTEADTPPLPPRGQTHACKNITLAQLRCGR